MLLSLLLLLFLLLLLQLLLLCLMLVVVLVVLVLVLVLVDKYDKFGLLTQDGKTTAALTHMTTATVSWKAGALLVYEVSRPE